MLEGSAVSGEKFVYFYQKRSLRKRQRETVKAASLLKDLKVSTNFPVDFEGNTVEEKGARRKHGFLYKLKTALVTYLPLLNVAYIKRNELDSLKAREGESFLYTWGTIPFCLGSSGGLNAFKFVVELDNPYVLTFYNRTAFRMYSSVIKKMLGSPRVHKIAAISKAAAAHTAALLGEEVKEKVEVIYPYVEDFRADFPSENSEKNDGPLKILFVGKDFLGKGGEEAIIAFSELRRKHGERVFLTIISDRRREDLKGKLPLDGVRILPLMPRDQVRRDYFLRSDIFLLPTFYESFGIVFLEALASGMAIVGTNVYAVPEMVVNGFNGYAVQHPFTPSEKHIFRGEELIFANPVGERLNVYRSKLPKLKKKMRGNYEEFIHGLVVSLEEVVERVEEFKQNSRRLFEEKFHPSVWGKNFLRLFCTS